VHESWPNLDPSRCRPFHETTTVKLATGVRLENMEENWAVLFHEDTGARVQVSTRVHRLLLALRSPASVRELVGASAGLDRLLNKLYDRGFLVDAQQITSHTERRLLMPSTHTLFHCPRVATGNAVGWTADIVALGVPFDLGSTVVGGQRHGPSALRVASNQFVYETALHDGRPLGWYDIDCGTHILEGIRIVDAGDFCFEYGEAVESIYDRMGLIWESLYQTGAMPVVLGGDHSITYPLVERLQRDGDITLVWFDAHTDESFHRPEQSHHYGNVLTRLLGLKGVDRVVRVGTRGAVSARKDLHGDRVRTISARELNQFGPAVLREAIPLDSRAYISIDLDVLDPSVAPAVGTPVPGGLTLRELEDAITVAALRTRVAAMDLVELNPERALGQVTASVASRVLLTMLHAATAGRRPAKQARVPATDTTLVCPV
jgi:agmatinase